MSRRGVALVLAVAVLASLGVIAATGFALARAERVAGLTALAEVQARAAAEGALTEALQGWPIARTPALPGDESPLARFSVPGPAEGLAAVRSLGGSVYALKAVGIRSDGGGNPLATVRVELLVLLEPVGPDSLVHPKAYPRGWRSFP
jgi:type II secretory pathway pseudopilin PulG